MAHKNLSLCCCRASDGMILWQGKRQKRESDPDGFFGDDYGDDDTDAIDAIDANYVALGGKKGASRNVLTRKVLLSGRPESPPSLGNL